MRKALRRFVTALTSVLVISAAFAAGMGVYAAVLALWPLVLVWFFAQLNGAHLEDARLGQSMPKPMIAVATAAPTNQVRVRRHQPPLRT